MIDNYEHYISKNIRANYRKRLSSPILYLCILLALFFLLPIKEIFVPSVLTDSISLKKAYENDKRYVSTTLEDLRFTGYTSESFGNTNGYYYYCLHNTECIFVLLSPNTCEEGVPQISSLTIDAVIVKGQESYQRLLSKVSKDLNWTENGIRNSIPNYYFSEPAYNRPFTVLFVLFYIGSMLYALISLILHILYINFPWLAPCCQNLIVFGNPKEQLAEAEEELATLPQLATEDMFITEHYFIMTSPYGNAIVPIEEILWIYKYSTLHKFLWYHFSISYTLHITTNKHLYIQCPKNAKSDIDGIIDYLAEANHNAVVGFSEENRLKVQASLGKPFHIEKFLAFFKRKI